MDLNRRRFLQFLGAGAVGGISTAVTPAEASSVENISDGYGVLVDTTECIGCRKCEFACNREHHLTDLPLERYEDTSVFETERWLQANAYTVVNRHPNPENAAKPTFVKSQCLHCLDPACASACLVGALQRQENGAVTYDAWKCMGCRYCMVACPFQVPAYEYGNALTPQVRKCTFCASRTAQEGGLPACVEMCPQNCLTYGKRSELLALAHEKIAGNPELYQDHVYGESEAGGTSWLYLAARPFTELKFQDIGPEPIPHLTETIQHSIFKFGALPLMLYGMLGAVMRIAKGGHGRHAETTAEEEVS
ncbi:MAG: 4Fe-4S dicluster domain-containing protein [Candidatus Hydrogenedentes bacterium]|nr:4Fe-4S dicluster domain-containing protein [Candidatus Hydrogenedentota bacterium]